MPRWGADQRTETELEKVASAPREPGARWPALGAAPRAGRATEAVSRTYAVCVIEPERVLLIDKPPTQDSGSKESFEQDKQRLVPQGGQLLETEAERAKRERALERDYAQAKVKWSNLAQKKDWNQVRADLSVYRYSGEEITTDPRLGEGYRDTVVNQLGFGED